MARFVLDVMCGGIAAPLRMCGHNAVYALDVGLEADARIRRVAHETGRTLLTRDRDLAARTRGAIRLDATDPTEQLRELRAAGVALDLDDSPTRCGRCNGPLDAVSAATSLPEYAPDPGQLEVWQCVRCEQLFWKGSHWEDVRERLD